MPCGEMVSDPSPHMTAVACEVVAPVSTSSEASKMATVRHDQIILYRG